MRLIVALALGLTACDSQPVTRAEAQEAERQSAQNYVQMQGRIDDLEMKVDDLERQLRTVRSVAIATSDAHDSLVKTFNGNVKKDNDQAVREMTAAGACGTRLVTLPNNGGWYNERIPCTVKDLR